MYQRLNIVGFILSKVSLNGPVTERETGAQQTLATCLRLSRCQKSVAGVHTLPPPRTLPGPHAGCWCYPVPLEVASSTQELEHPCPWDPTSNSHP